MRRCALFTGGLWRTPATVGTLLPASHRLARKATGFINFATARCIVEYEPGTGVFTDVLLQRRRPETVLVLVEPDHRFAQQLRERYVAHPNVHVLPGPPDRTGRHLRELGTGPPDYVLCGLPFSSLPRRTAWRILAHTRQLLLPGGKLVLVQYSRQNKPLLGRLFRLLRETHVLRNLPPAYVLVYVPNPAEEPNTAPPLHRQPLKR